MCCVRFFVEARAWQVLATLAHEHGTSCTMPKIDRQKYKTASNIIFNKNNIHRKLIPDKENHFQFRKGKLQ
jgi:succinylglutamate desuccinylase